MSIELFVQVTKRLFIAGDTAFLQKRNRFALAKSAEINLAEALPEMIAELHQRKPSGDDDQSLSFFAGVPQQQAAQVVREEAAFIRLTRPLLQQLHSIQDEKDSLGVQHVCCVPGPSHPIPRIDRGRRWKPIVER